MRLPSLLFPIVMLAFVAAAIVEFSSDWSGAERGIVLYERTCPLNRGG
jgi:hypothetical protein